MRFEDDSLLDKCLAAQPWASWEFIGGVRTLEYSEAALWAAAAAFGADNLGGDMQYYLRPTPAKMEETLNAAMASVPTFAKAQTLGQWLTALRTAADKIDAANRAARLVWTRGNMLRLPDPVTIHMTNAEGVPLYTEAPGPNVGDPVVRAAIDDATGWANGPTWFLLVSICDIWEKGSRSLLRVGMLWYIQSLGTFQPGL